MVTKAGIAIYILESGQVDPLQDRQVLVYNFIFIFNDRLSVHEKVYHWKRQKRN